MIRGMSKFIIKVNKIKKTNTLSWYKTTFTYYTCFILFNLFVFFVFVLFLVSRYSCSLKAHTHPYIFVPYKYSHVEIKTLGSTWEELFKRPKWIFKRVCSSRFTCLISLQWVCVNVHINKQNDINILFVRYKNLDD